MWHSGFLKQCSNSADCIDAFCYEQTNVCSSAFCNFDIGSNSGFCRQCGVRQAIGYNMDGSLYLAMERDCDPWDNAK